MSVPSLLVDPYVNPTLKQSRSIQVVLHDLFNVLGAEGLVELTAVNGQQLNEWFRRRGYPPDYTEQRMRIALRVSLYLREKRGLSLEEARAWFTTPLDRLRGRSPLSHLRRGLPSLEEVETELFQWANL